MSGAEGGTAGGGGDSGAANSSSQRNGRRGGGSGGAGPESSQSGRGGARGRGGKGRAGGRGGSRGSDVQPSGEGSNPSGGGQRRRGGGRGRGGHHDRSAPPADSEARPTSQKDPILRSTQKDAKDAKDATGTETSGDDAGDNAEVCFICANPVIHHAIAPCNHLTCHICALRMRALYRVKDCPHCRTPAPYVIFTDDPSKRFEAYTAADTTSTDDNIGIKYTNEDIVGDTVLLLRYNCPDDSCDYAGLGWPDLHRHVRSAHHKKMCDLCTRNKKVFTHEHELFSDKALETHMRHGNDRPGAIDQSGFRGHPLCSFCGERFYDDDKLYEHCRNKHERCFICDRRDSRQPHYYRNYNELEKHFRNDHLLCMDRECLEKKFVVFESELDLKAHQLSEHGNTLSKDVRRDVQVVSMADFNFRPAPTGRGHGHGHGQNQGGGSGAGGRQSRGRDPNADAPAPVAASQNMRRDEIAFQRQMNIHSAQTVSNRTFGSHLSAPTPGEAATLSNHGQGNQGAASSRQGSGRNTPRNTSNNNNTAALSTDHLVDPMEAVSMQDVSQMTPQERARVVRHGAVIERASNLLGSNPAKVNAFRSHISSFRSGKWTATQLIDAFSALFADTSDTALGSLVREVADLFDDAAKADALRKALNDRRAVHEDYPSLPTLGGMHGATTSTSGWAAAASASPSSLAGPGLPNASSAQRQSSTRVLRLKHSTRLGGSTTNGSSIVSAPTSSTGPSGRPVPGATWTAPPRASPMPATAARTSSLPVSTAFPALPAAGAGSNKKPSGSSWVAGGGGPAPSLASRVGGFSSGGVGPSSYSAPASGSSTPHRPVGEDSFPSLPAAAKPPPPAVFSYGRRPVKRSNFGGNADTGFSWGASGDAGGAGGGAAEAEEPEAEEAGKGKKKGKQGKKVLVQWG